MRGALRLIFRLMLASTAAPLMLCVGLAQPGNQHHIAYLSAGLHTSEAKDFFKEAMHALGYAEEQLSIESRYAEGDSQRLAGLAAELVRASPEIIVTGSAAAAVAAKQATSSIPIVTIFTADPVGTGLAASLLWGTLFMTVGAIVPAGAQTPPSSSPPKAPQADQAPGKTPQERCYYRYMTAHHYHHVGPKAQAACPDPNQEQPNPD